MILRTPAPPAQRNSHDNRTDAVDVFYTAGAVLISVGIGIMSVPFAIIAAGTFVILPPLITLFRE